MAGSGTVIELRFNSSTRNSWRRVVRTLSIIDRQKLVECVARFAAVAVAISILSLVGCSKSSSTGPTAQSSTIRGTVTDDQGTLSAGKLGKTDAAVQGAVVLAARVLADGTLSPMSDSAQTDANGHFMVTCDATNITNAVVIATKAGVKWEGVVSSNLAQGATETCAPLNTQTTAQAEVYIKMVTDVGADGVVFDDVGLYVSSEVAAAVQYNLAAHSQVAGAIEAGESAWQSAMVNSSIGNSSQQGIQAIIYARMSAQGDYQSALYAAGENQTSVQTAFRSYEADELGLYTTGDLSTDGAAKVHEVVARAMMNATVNASTDVRLALCRQAADIRAYMISTAVRAQLQLLGATHEELNNADTAYSTLVTSISASSTIDLIAASFLSYHSSIVTLTGGISGVNASTMADLDGQINAGGAAKTILLSAVSTQLTPQSLAQAYASFFATVNSSVTAGMTGMTGAKVQAVAEILMLTNMTA